MMQRGNSGSRHDRFDLNRFVRAQDKVYSQALRELKSGEKRTHWMWFVFPQIEGLGHSSTTQYYAIKSLEEARAYLNHGILGARLIECCEAILGVEGRPVARIFGYPDDLKLKSSMTLFEHVSEPDSEFSRVLAKYFGGARDQRTLKILARYGGA